VTQPDNDGGTEQSFGAAAAAEPTDQADEQNGGPRTLSLLFSVIRSGRPLPTRAPHPATARRVVNDGPSRAKAGPP
jgi:hypothetical protein